jgi:hypothetical protein
LVLDGNQDIYQNATLADDWMGQIDALIQIKTGIQV